MIGYQITIFVLTIVVLWALLSRAAVPSSYDQEHLLRTNAETQVAVESTQVAMLRQRVPTPPPYPFHP